MKYIIDRFEGEYAILEEYNTTNIINVLKMLLPAGVCEGDILEYSNGIYTILKTETLKREENIKDRFARLRKK